MQSFCRTCFRQTSDSTSIPLDSKNCYKYKLMLCVPEMDLRTIPDAKLCIDCVRTLNITYKFKIKCRDVEEKINKRQFSEIERLMVKQEINLDNTISIVCRICIMDIIASSFCFLTLRSFDKCKLKICVPEMDLQVISDVNLCNNCQMALDTIYTFKTSCLDVEKNIKEYLKLHDIIDFSDMFVWCNALIKNEINDLEDFTIKEEVVNTEEVKEEKITENVKYSKCEYNTTQKYVDRYIHIHTAEKPFKCLRCEYSTVQKSNLLRHIRTHIREKPFKCLHCEYHTLWKSHLTRHIHTHTGEKLFKCSHCEYSTANKYTLNTHIRTHTGEKPFRCSHCDYSTGKKSSLNAHIRTHTGEKPFKCLYCEFSTAQKSNLTQHIRKHTGDKPFKCTHCEYSTAQKLSLKQHIRTHTGEKPFNCLYCEYRTASQSSLKQHIRKHTGEKPFKCSHCEYTTSGKSNLIKHIRKHHDEKPLSVLIANTELHRNQV